VLQLLLVLTLSPLLPVELPVQGHCCPRCSSYLQPLLLPTQNRGCPTPGLLPQVTYTCCRVQALASDMLHCASLTILQNYCLPSADERQHATCHMQNNDSNCRLLDKHQQLALPPQGLLTDTRWQHTWTQHPSAVGSCWATAHRLLLPDMLAHASTA
jgi:hypothetical protein